MVVDHHDLVDDAGARAARVASVATIDPTVAASLRAGRQTDTDVVALRLEQPLHRELGVVERPDVGRRSIRGEVCWSSSAAPAFPDLRRTRTRSGCPNGHHGDHCKVVVASAAPFIRGPTSSIAGKVGVSDVVGPPVRSPRHRRYDECRPAAPQEDDHERDHPHPDDPAHTDRRRVPGPGRGWHRRRGARGARDGASRVRRAAVRRRGQRCVGSSTCSSPTTTSATWTVSPHRCPTARPSRSSRPSPGAEPLGRTSGRANPP